MTTEHKMSHVLRAIAEGVAVQFKPPSYLGDEWKDLDVSGHFSIMNGWEYRIKPKPKVKKWKWVFEDKTRGLIVTGLHYQSSFEFEKINPGMRAVIHIPETMIEVEESSSKS